ncbi:hypothetical protein [Microbacterium sp. PMB16]|uniref:hypothetical protein n=1 Tax=Microbacterium sp. PMB16 TaxID=3120157 RepID=UPI003F4C9796
MSGELEIDHGGVIAVDTDQLRDVGQRVSVLASRYADAREAIDRAHVLIDGLATLGAPVQLDALRASAQRVGELQVDADDAARATLLMADVFHVVELRARAEALEVTDSAAAASLRARVDRLLAADERIEIVADLLFAGWERERFEGLEDQWDIGGLLAPLFSFGAFIGVASRLGTILPGTPLTGTADPVTVTPVKTSHPSAPPATARGALERMPTSPGAQVAVEKYTMPDGEVRYTAYLKGTQNFLPWQAGGSEPWDMKSNAELYTGAASASYQATLDALAAAGAGPGDHVDLVAHSQSGLIAGRMAMESEFDVRLVMTAGSPGEPTLRDDQTLVQLLHTDDTVGGFAGGGSPSGTGSPDSFTATRVGDPDPGWQDAALRTHNVETYLETAQMVDESNDPRAEALDEYWSELGEAVDVERTEYRGERKE